MRKFILIAALFLQGALVMAQPEQVFEQANALYQQGDFAGAQKHYEQLLEEGYRHEQTFYNLGNACYRLGELGKAILYYEKALKVNPDNMDARHNLEIANRLTKDEFNQLPSPVLQRVFSDLSGLLNLNSWTVLALSGFFIALLSLGIFVFFSRHNLFGILLFTGLCIGLAAEGIAYGKSRMEQRRYGILTSPNSYIKSAPAQQAQDLYIIHEGTKVKITEEYEGWIKIALPDGRPGWVQMSDVSEI